MEIDKFNYFYSYYVALKGMKPAVRLAIRDAIDEYMFEGKEPVFTDPIQLSLWVLLFPNIKKTKLLALNRLGKTKDEQTNNESKTNQKQIDNKSVSDEEQTQKVLFPIKDKGNRKKEIGKEKKDEEKTPAGALSAKASSLSRFIKPTVDDVRVYCEENGYKINPNEFVDFYESKGWLVGKSPMKDWKAAVRTWASKDKKENPEKYIVENPKILPDKMTECPNCGSHDVTSRGDYGICNFCGKGFDWNYREGRWKESL